MSKDDHRPEVGEDRSFSVDGIKFFIDMAPINRRPSDSEAFTIAKERGYLHFYESLAKTVRPKSMLELGIFEGGSYVLLDKLFNPDRMSAVDIREKPVAALVEYMKGRTNRRAHFATSQSDEAVLKRIVREDLGGELDFVVDDASHAYEHTKRSFEILFPLLSPAASTLSRTGHGPTTTPIKRQMGRSAGAPHSQSCCSNRSPFWGPRWTSARSAFAGISI